VRRILNKYYELNELDDGNYEAKIAVVNLYENSSKTLQTSWIVDKQPPAWSNEEITLKNMGNKLSIFWSEAIDTIGLYEYILKVNNDLYRVNSASLEYIVNFEKYSELEELVIELTAVDVSGNVSDSINTVFIVPDITPPTFDGLPLINILEQTKDTIEISWPVFLDVSGIKEYRLFYESINNPSESEEKILNSTSYKFTNLPQDTKYSFRIYVIDNAGNEILCCSKVVDARDDISPVWTDETGVTLNVINNELIITWGAAEDNNRVDKYTIRLFGDENQIFYDEINSTINTYKFNLEDVELDGFISVKINAVDEDKNISNSLIKSIDFQPPTWTVDTLIELVIEDDNLTIAWDDAVDNTNIKNYNLIILKNSIEEEVLLVNFGINLIKYDISEYSSDDEITVQITASDGENLSSQLMNSIIVPSFLSNILSNLGVTSTTSSTSSTTSSTSSTTSSTSSTTSSTSSTTSSTSSTTSSTSSTTTTTIPEISYTPTGSLSGNCSLLSSSSSATSPLFKQVNNNVYPFGPTESAFTGYEGCMYSGLTKDTIKEELIRYLDYWKQFDKNEFKYLNSVQSRNWRNESALDAAVNRWGSEWSSVNSESIVDNLSRSDGQLVWDDEYWTVGLTTTTLATISDPTTENTVLGAPTITGTSLSGSTLTVSFDHAPPVKDLEIVAYGCSYYTVTDGPAGGVDGFEVGQKSCTLNIPTNYATVFVKAHAKYGNYVNCGQANETCVQINNAQWGPYTDWYAVTIFTPTTTTTPENSSESSDSTTTTTTTTLPPSNTTTTTIACKTLDEAKSLWLSNATGTKRGQRGANFSGYYIVESGGQSAIVDGSSSTVRYVSESKTLGMGDTYLGGENGDAGLLLWTHTVVEVSGSSIIAEYNPVWPDSEVERFARGSYTVCP
jgi:hypothetical protein